ncbi:hypothetical protein ACFFSY_19080 [Paenibacillus aurantiacus]|uniref:Uncharacterized protein n=1 Tax=Paenibacillus aurantiacus TaxID=1936118 RepID=A0ABV5KT65_9BACL
MSNQTTLAPGQELITDKDFELAVKHKLDVIVTQNGIRQRPITTLSGYNVTTATLSDGKRFLRSANKFHLYEENSAK